MTTEPVSFNVDNLKEFFMEIGCFTASDRKPDRNGYCVMTKKKKTVLIHRLLYHVFFQESIDGKIIRHTCDNPGCINPFHLKSGTHADNVQDRVGRKRSAIGENHGRHKLTEVQVREIKHNIGVSGKEYARRFGVDKMVIYRIRNGRYWKHVA